MTKGGMLQKLRKMYPKGRRQSNKKYSRNKMWRDNHKATQTQSLLYIHNSPSLLSYPNKTSLK